MLASLVSVLQNRLGVLASSVCVVSAPLGAVHFASACLFHPGLTSFVSSLHNKASKCVLQATQLMS